jgi:ABC-type multidrug transport system ATPase subunit
MRASLPAEDEAPALREVADAPAIRTRDLTKVYPHSVLAVERLSLDISRGEFFGLLGPNGAGKTTTVGMLTTRIVPTGGDMWVSGCTAFTYFGLRGFVRRVQS